MKKFLCIILCLLFMASCMISAAAADTEITESGKTIMTIGDWTYELISGGKYWAIDSYNGEDTDLVVPRIVNDVMVVTISDYCFNGDTSVKSVQTSSPLWNIGEYAFSGCSNLESVELNFALQTIGVGAFMGTHSLKNINLQTSVVTEIKAHAFMYSGIEEVTLPGTCEKIGNLAFSQCESLTRVTIPKSVTSIHEDAFKGSNNVVIYCYKDSYAHQYAEEKGIEYVLLDVPGPYRYLIGDANGDGEITIIDVTVTQRTIADIPVPYFDEDAANVSGDALDITDVTVIQRYLADIVVYAAVGQWCDRN